MCYSLTHQVCEAPSLIYGTIPSMSIEPEQPHFSNQDLIFSSRQVATGAFRELDDDGLSHLFQRFVAEARWREANKDTRAAKHRDWWLSTSGLSAIEEDRDAAIKDKDRVVPLTDVFTLHCALDAEGTLALLALEQRARQAPKREVTLVDFDLGLEPDDEFSAYIPKRVTTHNPRLEDFESVTNPNDQVLDVRHLLSAVATAYAFRGNLAAMDEEILQETFYTVFYETRRRNWMKSPNGDPLIRTLQKRYEVAKAHGDKYSAGIYSIAARAWHEGEKWSLIYGVFNDLKNELKRRNLPVPKIETMKEIRALLAQRNGPDNS